MVLPALCWLLLGRVKPQFILDHIVDFEVAGAEVMRPFTRTMDFIHTDHGDLPVELGEILYKEALRRYEKHLDPPILNGLHHVSLHLKVLL